MFQWCFQSLDDDWCAVEIHQLRAVILARQLRGDRLHLVGSKHAMNGVSGEGWIIDQSPCQVAFCVGQGMAATVVV
ncbi:hypothetical protein D3C81_1771450 [compost metagenome]